MAQAYLAGLEEAEEEARARQQAKTRPRLAEAPRVIPPAPPKKLEPPTVAEQIRRAKLAEESFFGPAYWLAVVAEWPTGWRDRYWKLVKERTDEGVSMPEAQSAAWHKACASIGVEP